jgi:hypothetical protein
MSDTNRLYLFDNNIIDPRPEQKNVYTVHQYEPTDYAQHTEGKWSFDCATKKNLRDAPEPKQYEMVKKK